MLGIRLIRLWGKIMSKILVLGGGYMGGAIARDLVSNEYEVSVADISMAKGDIPGTEMIIADLSSMNTCKKVMSSVNYDVVVGALPSFLGYGAIKSAIATGQKYVDLSYCEEDVLHLNKNALSNNALIIPDCGVAPGLSNLLAGRAINKGFKNIKIYVGGFAKDPSVPLGYAVSWSIEDLLDEFVRPARIIQNGRIETAPAMTGIEQVHFENIGHLDAFYTDGLRSLLEYKHKDIVTNKVSVVEKTMRRSGHLIQTIELVNNGEFVDYMKNNCVGHEDVLVMRVDADDQSVYIQANADFKMSAMAKSTALSCSAFAQMVANGEFNNKFGVLPPEYFSEDDAMYKAVMDKLADQGIVFSKYYPFL
jgi:lysine 6-dehydrogenase